MTFSQNSPNICINIINNWDYICTEFSKYVIVV